MTQVNRYLEDKAFNHIDHALGRPVDPMAETYRNYFYHCDESELRQYMTGSPHWTDLGGGYFAVSDVGRKALVAHLKAIGDKHRLWIVSWQGYDMEAVAVTRSQARYSKWLDISDIDDSLTFARFQRESKVRPSYSSRTGSGRGEQ